MAKAFLDNLLCFAAWEERECTGLSEKCLQKLTNIGKKLNI